MSSSLTDHTKTTIIRKRKNWTRAVNKRDLGECEICGLLTHNLWHTLRKAIQYKKSSRAIKLMHQFSWAIKWDLCGDHSVRFIVWEADHRIPLCLGGSDTLDNIRTLCIPCHRLETAKLNRR